MKKLFTLLLLLPSLVTAVGSPSAYGLNQLGEMVKIDEQVGEDFKISLRKTKSMKNWGERWSESYVLIKECPNYLGIFEGKKTFSCIPEGGSPLAGATYKVKTSKTYKPCNIEPFFDKTPGEIYVCIAGCKKPRVPKLLKVSPWEC